MESLIFNATVCCTKKNVPSFGAYCFVQKRICGKRATAQRGAESNRRAIKDFEIRAKAGRIFYNHHK